MIRNQLLLAAIVLVFFGCAIANHMDGVSKARDLQKRGVTADATILKVWDTGITVNNDPVVNLLLEVRPASGNQYEAQTKALISRIDVPQFQPGNVIPVVYDPNDPKQVAINVYKY